MEEEITLSEAVDEVTNPYDEIVREIESASFIRDLENLQLYED